MKSTFKVIIRRCPDYDNVGRIRAIVREGMEELGSKPRGKVLLKYNMVFAHRKISPFAHTHPNVLEAVIDALASRPEVEKIILGERTGVYMSTRYVFNNTDYKRLLKKPKVELCFFDEDKLVNVNLEKGVFHKRLRFSRSLITADYKVYAPKLKHHVTTKLTCALKLNIGICDQKERLCGHDYHLEEKIADLYEVGHPDFVVVDAIDVGQKNEIFPTPKRFGLIIMGDSGVAVDSVAARIIGFAPNDIKHLKIARSRGWPPVRDDQIEISSEVPWEEIERLSDGFDYSYSDLSQVETPARFMIGNHPGGSEPCWGGCINMLKGALAGFDAGHPGSLKNAKPVALVIGEYKGDVDGMGYPVLLVGKCSKVIGKIDGKTRRIPGCPVGIPIFTLLAPHYLKIPSPLLAEDPRELYKFPLYSGVALLHKFINRVF